MCKAGISKGDAQARERRAPGEDEVALLADGAQSFGGGLALVEAVEVVCLVLQSTIKVG